MKLYPEQVATKFATDVKDEEEQVFDDQSDERSLLLQMCIKKIIWNMKYNQIKAARAYGPMHKMIVADVALAWGFIMVSINLVILIWGGLTSEETTSDKLSSTCATWFEDKVQRGYTSVGLSTDLAPLPEDQCVLSSELRAQQTYEYGNDGRLEYTGMQRHPHMYGRLWTVCIAAHLVCGTIITLLTPFAINDALVNMRLVKSRAKALTKKLAMFGHWGPQLAVAHDFLMVAQITLGTSAAIPRLLQRGFTMYKWYAQKPGFSMALYLQFMALGPTVIAALTNYIWLFVYGFDVPVSRRWQRPILKTLYIMTLCCVCISMTLYWLRVFPIQKDIAYIVVNVVQVPFCGFFVWELNNFWHTYLSDDRLHMWQENQVLCQTLVLLVSVSTYWANIGLKLKSGIMIASVYVITHGGVLYVMHYLSNARDHPSGRQQRMMKGMKAKSLRRGTILSWKSKLPEASSKAASLSVGVSDSIPKKETEMTIRSSS